MHSKSVQFSISSLDQPQAPPEKGTTNSTSLLSDTSTFTLVRPRPTSFFQRCTCKITDARSQLQIKCLASSQVVIVSTANSGSQAGPRPSSSLSVCAIYRHKRKTHLIDYIAALTTRDRRLLFPPIQHTEWGTDSGGNFLVALSCFGTVLDM